MRATDEQVPAVSRLALNSVACDFGTENVGVIRMANRVGFHGMALFVLSSV
ncbi:hypothetical protein KCP77_06405 [Salmonella enterica subsp. enterica]|nr:hypothetical protein KCP77_06405 [Salmonella enterica subsp. enterica]